MEDMKGRIRVYVRVRPLSNSERERNCTEAVVKDGKLSVVLKMQDGKETYDFAVLVFKDNILVLPTKRGYIISKDCRNNKVT